MIAQETLLVQLLRLVERIPMPQLPPQRGRGRPVLYSDRLYLKALVIMIVRRLHKVHELLSVLAEPTPEMQAVRSLLVEQGRYPSRRTFVERRLRRLPQNLPGQIACLGRHLVSLIEPWAHCGRAAALDSTVLRARGALLAQEAQRSRGGAAHRH